MISNRDLVEKTKPILKDSYFQVFICIVLASALPQIISSISPQNVLLNIVVVCLSGYLQLGIAVYCLDVFNKGEGEFTTIFSRFNGVKPIVFILVLSVAIILGFILLIVPGIIISLGFSMTYYIMAEDPEIQFYEALESSWKIMDGNKMELLLLHLRFIPWYLLGLLFFVIGVFLVVPWHNLCITSYYKLIKQRNNNKIQRTI